MQSPHPPLFLSDFPKASQGSGGLNQGGRGKQGLLSQLYGKEYSENKKLFRNPIIFLINFL